MANIMQMFRAKNKVSRNAFDLSKKLAFTADAGELLPIYSRICMPGDRFNIRTAWKSRTAPVNTAAFTRFKEYYDWYFVPLQLLWNKYNTWSTNMKENNQVATSINGTTQLTDEHPYFTSAQISNLLVRMGFANDTSYVGFRNAFGYKRGELSAKLLMYLGYGDFYPKSTSETPQDGMLKAFKASPWRLLAYQKIYQDWYRNTQWENARPETCNIDYIDGSAESLQIPVADIDYSKVNMFDLQYANWNKDMFMGVLPNSQYGDEASVNIESLDDWAYLNVLSSDSALPNGNRLGMLSQTVTSEGRQGTVSLGTSFSSDLIEPSPLKFKFDRSFTSSFTILALRKAEALQKFKEIQQSNSQDFPSQTEAHFGHRPNNAYSQRCIRIGGYDGVIEIQDVDNTNITENEDGTMNGLT